MPNTHLRKLGRCSALLLATSPVIAQSFSAPKSIERSASGARSIRIEDLDGDGDIDVLLAVSITNEVTWYQNLGGGIFGPQQVISSSADGVRSVYSADLNGDGDVDVLSANESSDSVAWYENLGGGIFGPKQLVAQTTLPSLVHAADIDGDGDADVLYASVLTSGVGWIENLGGGNFQAASLIGFSLDAQPISTADIDGDGDTDVLTFSRFELTWQENLNSGMSWVTHYISPNLAGAESAFPSDFDGDGDTDVLLAIDGPQPGLSWFENVGNGVFGSMQPISSTAFDTTLAHAADLDADGDADALSASTWHANELGVFSPASDLPRTGQGLIAMESADLDGDFDIDVVFASSSTVFWLENLGTEDCNGNGSPDSQDVATGISTDCNGNGVPDECELAADASLDLNHNAIFDPCEALGQRYCSPVFPNSTGLPGLMTALGTTAIFLDDLTLTARSLPNDSFGYFITSRTQGYVFPVGGSQGALCVLGLVGRYVGPGQIMSSGKTGSFTLPVSVSSMPTPSGVVVASPGETWNFQAWYRDANPTVTSNFTDAVAVTFQ